MDERQNHFNLIRLFLAAGVLVSHCFPSLGISQDEPWRLFTQSPRDFGTICVQGFFILSGLLVSQSFERSTLQRYLAARALRIYPAAIVCAVLLAVVLGPLVSALSLRSYYSAPDFRHYLFQSSTFYGLQAKGRLFGVFPGNPEQGRMNTPLWTISWELLCYAI